VAVQILTWNRVDELVPCLESFACIDYPNYEVIVLDNGSEDESVPTVRERFPWVTLIENKENLGFCRGNNVGLRHVLERDFDYVLLLNSDTKVLPGLLHELVAAMEQDGRIAIAGAKNVLMENPDYTWGKYGKVTWGPMLVKTIGRFAPDDRANEPPRDVDWVIANGCLVRCDALRKIGLFDEEFWQCNEDVDWSYRAREAGYRVAVNYVSNRLAADALVAELEAAGGEAFAVKGDVGSEADILAMFEAVDKRFGRLDALVNNAGIVDAKARVDEMSAARLERMMRINVVGSILCAREAVKRMSTRHGGNGGAIVNISSAAAVLGAPDNYVDYAASKGAIDTFTIGLAREVALEGIRVNAVRPGIIDTDIHASGGQPDRVALIQDTLPMKRAGTADEVAGAVLYLLSDAASYTTGAILNVSGGR